MKDIALFPHDREAQSVFCTSVRRMKITEITRLVNIIEGRLTGPVFGNGDPFREADIVMLDLLKKIRKAKEAQGEKTDEETKPVEPPKYILEATAWLKGERSSWNDHIQRQDNASLALATCAQEDAARTEAAYWTLKAYAEGLIK